MISIEKLHPEKFSSSKIVSPLRCFVNALSDLRHINKSLIFEEFTEFGKILLPFLIKRLECFSKDGCSEVATALLKDPIFCEVGLTVQAVLRDPRSNFYVIQKDFFEKFHGVKLENVRFKDLFTGSGYIKLPVPIKDEDGTEYSHVYFYCREGDEFCQIKDFRCKQLKYECGSKLLEITLIEDPKQEEMDLRGYDVSVKQMSEGAVRSLGIRFPKDEDLPISSLFEDALDTKVFSPYSPFEQTVISKLGFPLYDKIIINLLAYIASGNPDIRDFRNTIKLPGQRKKQVRKSESLSALPIKLVGYDWKKNVIKNYSAESWEVSGFFRWQRYGTGLSLVKLIWIDPYVKSWR